MSTSSIELENVSLDYLIKTGSDSLKKTLFHVGNGLLRRKVQEKVSLMRNDSFRALNGVNLQLNKGDRVGVLGRNGAGKSTLLRVMGRIYQPTLGNIQVKGDLSSLFDINLGFNLEATGYENIINLGIMRGWNRQQAKSVVSDVESFTELGGFLDNPVRTYSSGMQMKLAFAVATSISPEILLIDEIIGVGDVVFMEKAKTRILKLAEQAQILVLTSHLSDVIERFCNKIIVMDKGEVKFCGAYDEGIQFYDDMLAQQQQA